MRQKAETINGFRDAGTLFSAEEIPLFASLKDSASSRPPSTVEKAATSCKTTRWRKDGIEMIYWKNMRISFSVEEWSASGGEVEITCSQMEVFLHAQFKFLNKFETS